jgi:hypothetical protein
MICHRPFFLIHTRMNFSVIVRPWVTYIPRHVTTAMIDDLHVDHLDAAEKGALACMMRLHHLGFSKCRGAGALSEDYIVGEEFFKHRGIRTHHRKAETFFIRCDFTFDLTHEFPASIVQTSD